MFRGWIKVDYNDEKKEYITYKDNWFAIDRTILIDSIFFPETYIDGLFGTKLIKDNLVHSEDFENIVICQLDNNVCLLEENNYVLSTFSTLEEANEFVEKYFINLNK